jgi:hypothetical protein
MSRGADRRPNRAAIIHELEQLGAVLSDVSPLLAEFYENLISRGMPAQAASDQVSTLLTHLLTLADRRSGEE